MGQGPVDDVAGIVAIRPGLRAFHALRLRFVAARWPRAPGAGTVQAIATPHPPEPAMNPFRLVTRPVKDLTEAIAMPFRAAFVVGLCWFINAMTFSGVWWVKWVALGMGIATVVALGRAARTLFVLAVVAWVGWKIYQRYGQDARNAFDAWVARKQPDAASVLRVLRTGQAA